MAKAQPIQRMSTPTKLVLRVLLRAPSRWLCGADIAACTDLGRPTVYGILQRLTDARWLVRRDEAGDPSELGRPLKRFYAMTSAGKEEAAKRLAA